MLVLGLFVFFGAHLFSAFRTREPGKDIKTRIGPGRYMGAYSLISGIGLGLIIYGYAHAAPTEPLFAGSGGSRNVTMLLMLPAMILIVAAYLPLGHLKRALRHPMLIAVSLWAVAHLMTGFGVREGLLFGSFLAFALMDIVAVSIRGGESEPAGGKASIRADLGAVVLGCAAYGAMLLWLHEAVIGVGIWS